MLNFDWSNEFWITILFNLLGFKSKLITNSVAVDAALKGSNEIPVLPPNDSLVFGYPYALGGKSLRIFLGIVKFFAYIEVKRDKSSFFWILESKSSTINCEHQRHDFLSISG